MFSEKMIGHRLITKQTGATGRLCSAVRRALPSVCAHGGHCLTCRPRVGVRV
jgi:ferredoxin